MMGIVFQILYATKDTYKFDLLRPLKLLNHTTVEEITNVKENHS